MPERRSRKYGVIKRGEKWVARPYIPGVGHEWVGTFDTEDEAVDAAKARIEERRRMAPSKETVASFVERWLTDYHTDAKVSTREHYRQGAKLFAREHGPRQLRSFGKLDARRFTNAHRAAAISVRVMFNDAIEEGLIEVNPFSGLKAISKATGRRGIKVLSATEVKLLLALAKAAHSDDTFWQFVSFAFHVGMRPAELYGLEWADIDVDTAEITVKRQIQRRRVTTPKNGKSRRIILTPPAAEALATIPKEPLIHGMADETGRARPFDLIFRNKSGGPMSQTAQHHYWQGVRTAFEAALPEERREELRAARNPKHPEMDLYEGRHYCATWLLEKFRAAGEDGASDVATQLGHTDDGKLVRELYGHPSDDLARERLKRLFDEPTPLRPVEDGEAANG